MFDVTKTGDIVGWQAFMCFVSPEALRAGAARSSIGEELTARYSPAFKIHFYLIALLMILAIMGIVHGIYMMHMTENYSLKKPLIIQTISTALYVGLCIFACFTAFYRTGGLNISALSSPAMLFIILCCISTGRLVDMPLG